MDVPLGAEPLDRAAHLRHDLNALHGVWDAPGSLSVSVTTQGVEVDTTVTGAVAWRPTTGRDFPTDEWAFLGLDGDGGARFAVGETDDDTSHRVALRDLALSQAQHSDPSQHPLPDARRSGGATTVSPEHLDHGPDSQVDPDLSIVVSAVGLRSWHDRHPFCPRCGEPSSVSLAGWARQCDSHQLFPQVEPAVIMLVTDPDERALLVRQRRWPPRWFSVLAGFVEPGETLESAVAREVVEEAAIHVHDVEYVASQPWPFPSSLMVGFRASADGGQVPVPDGHELAEARWFSRQELSRACRAGDVLVPPALSISRLLIQDWYGSELESSWGRS